MDIAGHESGRDLPHFVERSSTELEALRRQMLHVNLGAERVKFHKLGNLPDPDVRVAYCTTALRRPTVAMALVINLSLTWKRRHNITWHVVDFNEDWELSNT